MRMVRFLQCNSTHIVPLYFIETLCIFLGLNKEVIKYFVFKALIFIFANFLLLLKMWEPTIAEIIARPDCPPIYDIWSLDNVLQGDSAILNRERSIYACK